MADTPIYSTHEDFWIKEGAINITLNALGDYDKISVSLAAGTVVMAFLKVNGVAIIDYNAGHNYRTWALMAANTQFDRPDKVYVYVRLSKRADTAMLIYPYEKIPVDPDPSNQDGYYYIMLGSLTASTVDGNRVERHWDDAMDFGNLGTRQQENESSSELQGMFQLRDNVTYSLKDFTFDGGKRLLLLRMLVLNGNGSSAEITSIATTSSIGDNPGFAGGDTSIVTSAAMVAYQQLREAILNTRFLRKDQDDTTPYKLTMGEALVKRGLAAGSGTSNGNLTVEGGMDVALDSTMKGMTTVGTDGNLNPVGKDSLTFDVKGKSKMRTVVFGDYVPGLIAGASSGALIEKSGDARFKSVSISEFLEVPEIRFNRATVSVGIGLRSEGGGIIDRVEPDIDGNGNILPSGWVRLKLEEGEYGAIEYGDLNLGFWHNEVLDSNGDLDENATIASNASANFDPKNGDYELRGFQSVYFRIDALGVLQATDEDEQDTSTGTIYLRHKFEDEDGVVGNQNNARFHYTLRGNAYSIEPTYAKKNFNRHPHVGMHFGCIGNNATRVNSTTNITEDVYPNRQRLNITTPSYELMLDHLDSWNYSSNNIVKIEGDLTGFSMTAVDDDGTEYTKWFSGTGIVLGNAYIFGKLDQFERVGYRGIIHQSRGGFISPNMTEIETMTIVNGYGEDVTSRFTNFWVTRDSGDSESDTIWNNTRGHQCGGAGREDNTFEILFSDLRYVEGGVMGSRLFIFNASDITGQSRASVAMEFTT